MKSWLASECREYGAAILSFALLIGGSLLFLRISRETQFHQLAIGTAMFSITLAAALALFELCWRAGAYGARRVGLGDKD
jgi:hypothetical protein